MGAKFWRTARFAKVMGKIGACARRARTRHWALAGGNAADYWSNPPVTLDIDIVVSAEPKSFWGLVSCLKEERGFLERREPYEGEGGWPGLAMLRDPALRVDVDLMFPAVPFEARAARTAVPASSRGFRFRVVRPEYLVAMKLYAGRPKDIRASAAVLASAKARIDGALLDELIEESGASRAAVKMARILSGWIKAKKGG